MSALLEIDGLHVTLAVDGERREIIRDVHLAVGRGEALGLVGESGSGKSMTLRAILRRLPPGAEMSGELRVEGTSLMGMDARALRRYRAGDVAVIFQDPRAHINPVRTIGDFLTEGLIITQKVKPRAARERVAKMLGDVGIADAARRLRQHPHELSGGLLQRVMIASALVVEPKLILADEPTTALDVTTQEEVMAILDEQRRERGLAMIFVSHDLDLAAAVCDRTAVMYAGTIVESAPSAGLHENAAHPYTVALMDARPGLHDERRLRAIPGRPLPAYEAPDGCPFAPRCARVQDRCRSVRPLLEPAGAGAVACHFPVGARVHG